MEKKRPHYVLQAIQSIVARRGSDAFTVTALTNARLMGLSAAETISVVMSLKSAMFYKSMTTHEDSKIWQDVYHAPTPVGITAYIKVTLQDGAVVIQFKER
jgi:motility quorum-sensing regulator/GCU-specific mRNA interferase toxin